MGRDRCRATQPTAILGAIRQYCLAGAAPSPVAFGLDFRHTDPPNDVLPRRIRRKRSVRCNRSALSQTTRRPQGRPGIKVDALSSLRSCSQVATSSWRQACCCHENASGRGSARNEVVYRQPTFMLGLPSVPSHDLLLARNQSFAESSFVRGAEVEHPLVVTYPLGPRLHCL